MIRSANIRYFPLVGADIQIFQNTWTYIGYACRMAVELGLNRYTQTPPESETPLQRLERRNRERTYLILFVHDRSLSMQTGRLWMLPEVCPLSSSQSNLALILTVVSG